MRWNVDSPSMSRQPPWLSWFKYGIEGEGAMVPFVKSSP
jgi:hypothetical protein